MKRAVIALFILLCFVCSLFIVGCGVEEKTEEAIEPVIEEKKAEPDMHEEQQDAEKEVEVKTQ